MVYFYKRKANGEIFCIDDERVASRLHRDKKYDEKYEFIGNSSGQTYARIIAQKGRLSKMEAGLVSMPEEAIAVFSPEQRALYLKALEKSQGLSSVHQEAFDAELKEAMENPAKKPPRDFSKMGLNGDPLGGGLLTESLNQLK